MLTHFPPVDTYGSELVPVELAGAVERFAEHAWSRWSLVPFGFGDGGGGPTREMLAYGHRCADLDGVPPVTFGSPAEFFAHVEAEAAAGAPVPVWRGELYFETHRGTLTSQLGTKLGNRRCERLLRECELWSTTAALAGRGDGDPHALDAIWREVLTQQFHDILPGSSIAWVHEDAEETFGRVAADLEQRIAATLGWPRSRRRHRGGQRRRRRPRRGDRRRRRSPSRSVCRRSGWRGSTPSSRRAITSASPSPSRWWSPTARWPTAAWRSAGTSTGT